MSEAELLNPAASAADDAAADRPSEQHTGDAQDARPSGLPSGWIEEDDTRRRELLEAGKRRRAATVGMRP